MESTSTDDVASIVEKDSWTAADHEALRAMLRQRRSPADRAKALLGELEAENPEPRGAAALKIGILRYMLCRFEDALEALAAGTDNKDRWFFQAECYKHERRYDEALQAIERAEARGWDADDAALHRAEVQALAGATDDAAKTLGRIEKRQGATAAYHYVRGLIHELSGDGEAAAAAYEQARQIDPGHPGALFRLAYYSDLHGDEERAIELYEASLARPPAHANALLNLAVLHEDAGRYDQAISCLRRVLATNPNHPRARLFLRDAEACRTMYYDEDQARWQARRNAVLDIPVTDFELSVRARNCLKKMNIRTLGDLVRTSEAELLAYKNFGETSLKEIKDMLATKNLRLGQALEEGEEALEGWNEWAANERIENQGVLATPLEQVEMSIRSRRALESLNIATLGELASKTEGELLACKNFGQTSLNEVRQRLMEYGLQLRDSE